MASQEHSSPSSTPQQRSSVSLNHLENAKPYDELSNGNQGAAEKHPAGDSSEHLAPNQNPEPEWAHGFQLFTILAAVTFVVFLMLLDGTIVVAAVPRITDEFNSLEDIGWYGAAYQLGRYVTLSF